MMLTFILLIVFVNYSNGLSIPRNPIVVIKDAYLTSLNSNPMFTNIATASILAVFSDSISQNIEIKAKKSAISDADTKNYESPKFSLYRSFCMSIYGAGVLGWFVSIWFKFLNSIIPRENINLSKALVKIAINQALMSPILNSFFFGYVIFTRDFIHTVPEKISLFKKKIQKDLIPTIIRSTVYWTIAHLYNFLILNPKYQLLYTNSAFVIWTIYLSIVGYRIVK